MFAATALAAAATALAADRRAFRRACAEPLTAVLLALAGLGALSALWTLGPEERTLRWAAVTLGYAAVLVAAAVAARDARGRTALAAGVGAIAVVALSLGVAAALAHEHPYALDIGGGWRAAGPFEYPPALALLAASAIPLYLALGRLAAVPLALVAATLLLAESRIGLALGIAIGALAFRDRRVLVPALAVALVAGAVAFGSGDGPESNFVHGRDRTWSAAVDTFLDRPLAGAGADAFLAGSARHQDGAAILFAHNLPLELAAELGVAGLLLALALYAAAARLLWRTRSTEAARLFAPAAAAFLLASLLDWPWHLAGAGAVWALAAGALAAAVNSTRAQRA